MQFREQARKLQLIRSTYDPAAKRSHQKVVVSLPRWTREMPSDEVLRDLTAEERQELADYLAARKAESLSVDNRLAVKHMPNELAKFVRAIEAGEPVTADAAEAIWSGMAAVAKALRKAGHPKPRKAPQKPAQAL